MVDLDEDIQAHIQKWYDSPEEVHRSNEIYSKTYRWILIFFVAAAVLAYRAGWPMTFLYAYPFLIPLLTGAIAARNLEQNTFGGHGGWRRCFSGYGPRIKREIATLMVVLGAFIGLMLILWH